MGAAPGPDRAAGGLSADESLAQHELAHWRRTSRAPFPRRAGEGARRWGVVFSSPRPPLSAEARLLAKADAAREPALGLDPRVEIQAQLEFRLLHESTSPFSPKQPLPAALAVATFGRRVHCPGITGRGSARRRRWLRDRSSSRLQDREWIMWSPFRVFRINREQDAAQLRETSGVIARSRELLRCKALSDTFLGRKTQEPFPRQGDEETGRGQRPPPQ